MRDIVGKPPGEEESSTSSEPDEYDALGDLPEPGTGEIIRPEQATTDKVEKRSSAMSTGQNSARDKRATKQLGDRERSSKVLDKTSTPGAQ